jgi:tetratricopeptide (TPR) repeat protein
VPPSYRELSEPPASFKDLAAQRLVPKTPAAVSVVPGVTLQEGPGVDELVQMRNETLQALKSQHGNDAEILASANSVFDAAVEHASVQQREWTDHDFQDGEAANLEKVNEMEMFLGKRFAAVAREQRLELGFEDTDADGQGDALQVFQHPELLDDARNLGGALDLVGAYLKNYLIDKADLVMSHVYPRCRKRGGLWLIKALNHYSTVRMKQSRYQDALDMLKEMESLVPYDPDTSDDIYVSDIFDKLYRNLGTVYSELGERERALYYFERAVEVKKGLETWFDLWDVGKARAILAFDKNDEAELRRCLAMVQKARVFHERDEPEDRVMLAKITHSVGEVHLALKDLGEACREFTESYELFLETVGANNPLTGRQARAVVEALVQMREWERAKPYLWAAFECEGAADVVRARELVALLDHVVHVHQMSDDREGLNRYRRSIPVAIGNVSQRGLKDSDPRTYGELSYKAGLVELSMGDFHRASRSLEEAVRYLPQDHALLPLLKPMLATLEARVNEEA